MRRRAEIRIEAVVNDDDGSPIAGVTIRRELADAEDIAGAIRKVSGLVAGDVRELLNDLPTPAKE